MCQLSPLSSVKIGTYRLALVEEKTKHLQDLKQTNKQGSKKKSSPAACPLPDSPIFYIIFSFTTVTSTILTLMCCTAIHFYSFRLSNPAKRKSTLTYDLHPSPNMEDTAAHEVHTLAFFFFFLSSRLVSSFKKRKRMQGLPLLPLACVSRILHRSLCNSS